MTQQVTLLYPPKVLSPNARPDRRRKTSVAKNYRHACMILTMAARLRPVAAEGPVHVLVEFFPPIRRARDDDNQIASFKSGRDGVADALKIDDRRLKPRYVHHSEPRPPHGAVVLTFGEPEPGK